MEDEDDLFRLLIGCQFKEFCVLYLVVCAIDGLKFTMFMIIGKRNFTKFIRVFTSSILPVTMVTYETFVSRYLISSELLVLARY